MAHSDSSGLVFRQEEPGDYAAVEALTREAFWNVYQPGCDEHYIIHSMRGSSAVIRELNWVCEDRGRLCGHIFYTRTKVVSEDGQAYPVISFGPVSVHPDDQKKGIGSALIRMTLEMAGKMKFPGAVITGNPQYYHRFGFRPAADYGIVFEDGSSFPALMACELETHGLDPVHGRMFFCREFTAVDQEALLAFDRQFPERERLKLPGQLH